MRVLAVSGSLRRGSYNSALLADAAAEGGSSTEFVFWNRLDTIPAYDEDVRPEPAGVALFRELLVRADAVIFATPEYNGSVPGALKNALDWISRPLAVNPLRGKPVAVVGASQGAFGAVWAQAELRKILRALGAGVIDRELAIGYAQHAFSTDGRLRAPEHRAALGAVLELLLGEAGRGAGVSPRSEAAQPPCVQPTSSKPEKEAA
jgi:chromate reductase